MSRSSNTPTSSATNESSGKPVKGAWLMQGGVVIAGGVDNEGLVLLRINHRGSL